MRTQANCIMLPIVYSDLKMKKHREFCDSRMKQETKRNDRDDNSCARAIYCYLLALIGHFEVLLLNSFE